jgi:cysteine desulfurase
MGGVQASEDGVTGFLDYASGGPLHPAAVEALHNAWVTAWADPSRRYRAGRQARLLLDAARQAVADTVGCQPDEISFPPSGVAAVQRALAGGLAGRRRTGPTLVTSAVEHSAVLHAAETHEDSGGQTVLIPVNRYARLDLTAFQQAVGAPGVALASVQSANQEVGTRQPLAEVAAVCRTAGVPWHTDAGASLGYERVDVTAWGCALLTADARTWGGPSGAGVLMVRRGTRFVLPSADDEPENVPAAAAAAAALLAVTAEQESEHRRLAALIERLRTELPRRIDGIDLIGDPDPAGRVPQLLTCSFLYLDSESLLERLDRAGIAVTSGSACTTDTLEPSHVLAAAGAFTAGNIRVSVGAQTTNADIDRLLAVLPTEVARLRAESGTDAL